MLVRQSDRDPSIEKRVTVIINPVSCVNNIEKTREQILARFAFHNCTPNFVETLESTPTIAIAKAVLADGANLIVAAGGDGTIMETANALIGTAVPLGIIPLGTGNLLALNLGLPTNIEEAIDVVMAGAEGLIDLIRVNGGERYFAIMGGVGFDAQIMENTDRLSKQRFGRMAYIWTAIMNLDGELFPANVQIDDQQEFESEVKSVLIANMGLLGPNFSAFPEAKPDDGYMRVGLLKAASTPDFVRLIATAVVEGTPEPDPLFEVFTCKSVRIHLNRPQLTEFDGDIAGTVVDLLAEVAPNALRVMRQSPV